MEKKKLIREAKSFKEELMFQLSLKSGVGNQQPERQWGQLQAKNHSRERHRVMKKQSVQKTLIRLQCSWIMGGTAPGMRVMLGKRMVSPQCFILLLSHRLKETVSHLVWILGVSLKQLLSVMQKPNDSLFGRQKPKKIVYDSRPSLLDWSGLITVCSLSALKRICQAIWVIWPLQSYRTRKKRQQDDERQTSLKFFLSKCAV